MFDVLLSMYTPSVPGFLFNTIYLLFIPKKKDKKVNSNEAKFKELSTMKGSLDRLAISHCSRFNPHVSSNLISISSLNPYGSSTSQVPP